MADSKDFKTDVNRGATVTCTSTIDSPSGLDPNDFLENQTLKNLPTLPVSDLVSSITFNSTIPSGYYLVNGTSLEHYDKDPNAGGVLLNTIASNGYLDSANKVKFKTGGGVKVEVSDNAQIAFDAATYTTDPNVTGNFTLIGASLKFATSASIYAPGDGTRDYTAITGPPYDDDAPYNTGNVNILYNATDTKVMEGQGNIFSFGTINVEGDEINAGLTSENIALFASGDINLTTHDDTLFRGLIYTQGDFRAEVELIGAVTYKKKGKHKEGGTTVDYKYLTIEGALIAVGQDPNSINGIYDPGKIDISADRVNINFDDTVLESLKGGSSDTEYKIQSWHEF